MDNVLDRKFSVLIDNISKLYTCDTTPIDKVTKKQVNISSYVTKTDMQLNGVDYKLTLNVKVSVDGLVEKDVIELVIPNMEKNNSRGKSNITIGYIQPVTTIYNSGIAANKVYINYKDDEVSVGEFHKVSGIERFKRILSTMEISNEDFEHVHRTLKDQFKSEYSKEKAYEKFESLPAHTKLNFLKFIQSYEISERVRNKLCYTLQTKDIPSSLSLKFIEALEEIYAKEGSSRKSKNDFSSITPFDVKFIDSNDALLSFLIQNKKMIKNTIYRQLSQNKRLYAKSLQTFINRFLTGYNVDTLTIQQSQETSPVSLATQAKKVYFSTSYNIRNKVPMNIDNFPYIIDPIHTQEASPNIKNHFTEATRLYEGEVYVTLFDKNFKLVEIPLFEAMSNYVLSYSHVNYRTKAVIPNAQDSYSCCIWGKYENVPLRKVKYIRTQESLCDPSSLLVPSLNKVMSIRGMFGVHMQGQAIPVVGSTTSIVYSEGNKKLYDKSTTHIRSEVSGVVKYVDAEVMIVESEGLEYRYEVPNQYIESASHTFNVYHAKKQVGDKVKPTEILFELNAFKDGEIAMGVPLLTMFGTWFGMENNDGVIMSRSAAKKFAHESLKVFEIAIPLNGCKLKYDGDANNIFDKLGIPKIGDTVQRQQTIFEYGKLVNSETSEIASIYKQLTGNQHLQKSVQVKVPYDIETGKVIRVEIFPVGNTFKSTYKKDFQELQSQCNTVLKLSDKSDWNGMAKTVDAVIRIHVAYQREVTWGDKFCCRWANKGTVAMIMEDEDMPRLQDGTPVEYVTSAMSLPARSLLAPQIDVRLGALSAKLYQLLSKGKTSGADFTLKFLYPNDYDKGYEYIFNTHKHPDAPYMRFYMPPYDVTLTIEILNKMLNELGLGSGDSYVYDKTGRKIRNKVTVGVAEIYRTHFIASSKLKVNATAEYVSDIYGYGEVRKGGGQKLGEQDIFAILAYGVQEEIFDVISESEDKAALVDSAFTQIMMRVTRK